MTTLLVDIGGTHARLAILDSPGRYSGFHKYRLNDVAGFADIIRRYQQDTGRAFNQARFAHAREAVDGVIAYKRHAGDADYAIDFNALKKEFGWSSTARFNDLEAAMMGVPFLTPAHHVDPVITSSGAPENDHRLLVSIGTGQGHAALINGAVIKTHGGHFLPPVMEGKIHEGLRAFIRAKKDSAYSVMIEDFISSRGLCHMAEYVSGQEVTDVFDGTLVGLMKENPDIARLFFDYLGAQAHVVAGGTGLYGGVYYTGGVIDYLYDHDLCDWAAYHRTLKSRMVSVVDQSYASIPVYYVRERELPLLGLTSEAAV